MAPNTHSWEVVEEELFSRSWMDARAVNPQPSEHILSLPAPPPARGGGEGNRPWEGCGGSGPPMGAQHAVAFCKWHRSRAGTQQTDGSTEALGYGRRALEPRLQSRGCQLCPWGYF